MNLWPQIDRQLGSLSEEQKLCLVRSLGTVARVQGEWHPTALVFIDAAQRWFLNTSYELANLADIQPNVVATVVTCQTMRRYLVESMVIVILVTRRIDIDQLSHMQQFVQHLEVSPAILTNLYRLQKGYYRRLSVNIYVRCFIAQKYWFELRRQGWRWLLKGMINYFGIVSDRLLAQRYHQLQALPPETLGYQYWQFCRDRQYAFSGEKGGTHERTCFHDVTHVLGGYDTTSAGELQVVAMTVGYQRYGDPFASLWFILLHQHLGIQAGILSSAKTGLLDQPGMAEQFIYALWRGLTMPVDLSREWDHWTTFGRSLEELQKEYGIPPLSDFCGTAGFLRRNA